MSLIDRFLALEEKHNLFELEAAGVCYWPWLRVQLFNDIVEQLEETSKAHAEFKDVGPRDKLKAVFSLLWNSIYRNPLWFLKQKDILVLNHTRRVFNGKYYECKYTERVLEKIPWSYCVLENPHQGRHFKPVRTKNLRCKDYIDLMQEIHLVVYCLTGSKALKGDTEERLNEVLELYEQAFGVVLEKAAWKKKAQKLIRKSLVHRKYFRKILRRVKPQLILEVVGYTFNRGVMNVLAAESGIPTVELQHGIIGEGHIAYNFAVPRQYAFFPDYIFLFGTFWKDTARFPLPEQRLIVTGAPYFEDEISKKMSEPVSQKEPRKTILFISQGTIGLPLSRFAVALSEKLDTAGFRLLYKLHPGEYSDWKKNYPELAAADIEVIDNSEQELYALLKTADAAVGVYSTAVFEALTFGCKLFIVKLFGHERMQQLYQKGLATLVGKPDELAVALQHQVVTDEQPMWKQFWTEKSLDNIVYEMNQIIGSSAAQ